MIYSMMDIVYKLDVDDLKKLLEVISFFYLSPKEKNYFLALYLYYGGKRQRELSIMFEVLQSKISTEFTNLTRKLRVIGGFLTEVDITSLLEQLEKDLTKRQFEILCYLLAGNRQSKIARHFKCTPAAILCIYRNACRRIRSKPEYSRMFQFFKDLRLA